MNKPVNSPLPWHQFEHCEGHSINDVNGHHVAYTDWDSEGFDTEDAPADHNAAFIVTACNSHGRFIASLEAIVEAGRTSDEHRVLYLVDIAREALAFSKQSG